jgi:hypothetical protein
VILLYKSTIIFIGLLLGALLLITYIPSLSIWFLEKPTLIGQWEYKDENGNQDLIIIKTGNQYLRKKGSAIDIMLNDPYYGKYQDKNNRLTLITAQGKEEYNYEIYNNGIKLLLNKLNSKEDSAIASSLDAKGLSNGHERIFYKNLLSPPLGVHTGQFIGKWQTAEGDTLEFYFNGMIKWIKNGQEKDYRYQVINKNKIKLILNTANDNANSKDLTTLYNYKFNDSLHFIMRSKKAVLNLENTDSSSDL